MAKRRFTKKQFQLAAIKVGLIKRVRLVSVPRLKRKRK